MNFQQVLVNSPQKNEISCFELRQVPIPEVSALPPGFIIVETKYISIDPYNRILLHQGVGFPRSVSVGKVMNGLVAGKIVGSNSPNHAVGEWVFGELTWENFCVCDSAIVQKIPKDYPHPHHYIGVLGICGITAYIGVKEILNLKPGETLVVSAAAGGVGELAVQIGCYIGAKVIGIAGSEEKCKYVKEIGASYCINYKNEKVLESLKLHCPNGIDAYFDNVGGETLENVIDLINRKGRIALCGMISQYGNLADKETTYGVRNLFYLIGKSVKMEGFLMGDFVEKHDEMRKELIQFVQKGMKFKEEFSEGLEQAPKALEKIFKGENKGKSFIRIV